MAPINVVAVLYPKQGKTDQVIELLSDVAEYVLANEPGTLQYEVTRSLRPAKDGTEDIVMIEKYKDTESLKIHGGSQKFQNFQKMLAEKDLIRAPPLLKTVSGKSGFSSRL